MAATGVWPYRHVVKRLFQNSGRARAPTLAALLISIFSCLTCQATDRASWYGEQQRGLPMANGQRFNPDRLTAASWFFNFGTKVVVTHANRSVVVEITDRGPTKRLVNEGRKIDLSRAAFAKLADLDFGLIDVTVRKQ
jgi:rare lipoprotein A (peptidoglycan hydrolase)